METDRVPPFRARVTPAEAAFGKQPGADVRSAVDEVERWQRAIALAGRGYYARARAEIAAVGGDDAVQSLVLSARASWLRQMGWHHVAAGLDGMAVRLADAVPHEARRVEAMSDAITGLAADGIGQSRLGTSVALLRRVTGLLQAQPENEFWRQRVRVDWVAAEAALALGDARAALPRARAALSRAQAEGGLRHAIKSRLLVAAATAGCGDLDGSGEMAAIVARECGDNGLLPLEWAASMLLAGVHPSGDAIARAQECEQEIERRGGRFR